ncbi:MAG: uracil-DNA glycosylase [Nocardioidaceae bacterium]
MTGEVRGGLPSALPHPLTGQRFVSPVPPGTGWPEDPLARGAVAPAAGDGREVVTLAGQAADVQELSASVSVCRACPRLVDWRESVAVERRRAYAAEPYWGRPITGWGSSNPRVLIVGLAPAAHGGNRTGRIFTGDRSGDWLFASLHRVGLASQPTSVHAGDGQRLIDTRMVAAVRCAPPANKPTLGERDTCAPWLDAELRLVLPSLAAVVCLGMFAWEVTLRALARQGLAAPRPRPRFGHGAEVLLERADLERSPDKTAASAQVAVLASFHPSQQNTFTGKLTEPMLDAVLARAASLR